jgi:hypothetical protein
LAKLVTAVNLAIYSRKKYYSAYVFTTRKSVIFILNYLQMPQCSVKRRICIWHKTPILFWPHGWLPWLCNIKTADTTSIFAYHRPTVICTYLLSGFMLHDTFCNIKPIAVWLQIASHTWCKISEQSVSHIFMS